MIRLKVCGYTFMEFRWLRHVTHVMLAVEFNMYVISGQKTSLQACSCAGDFVYTSLLPRKSGGKEIADAVDFCSLSESPGRVFPRDHSGELTDKIARLEQSIQARDAESRRCS